MTVVWNRYVAVLVYEATSDAPRRRPLYEETFVLVRAASAEQAGRKATRYGRAQETSYRNETGETIRLVLRHVVDVSPVLDDSVRGGHPGEDVVEVYARHFRNYDAYRRFEPLLSDHRAR
ncbi:hypothetical protein GCM10012275_33040 [Longimycelium tulufanense]|uniref:DUF4288 domain-containing protein n=1 Tax=Longimycelium tulufanense TaxID=907463 RepID=A0A8J3C956_9PSEU|nr:DUF4288 domain-containing protein [Longimycelium tulufanense]GGM59259.1 hypothetical protein GCM10012275_33040 [Longimycelium tulufanense]